MMEARPGPARGYWLRIAMVIAAASAATTVLRVVWGGGALIETLTRGVVYSGCIGALAGLILPPVRHRVCALGRIVEWVATLLALLVVAIAGTLLASVILGALGFDHGQSLTQRFVACFELNALITAIIGVAVTLYESQRVRLDALTLELRTKELERERDRKMALEARLSSLESRLHPHFLFNTLNAISALVREDPDEAERTVERLAALLRFSLDATQRGLVPVADELKIVTDYLEIERTRLGERLSYALKVAPAVTGFMISPLLVQTLVENSVKHAIAPRLTGGHIRVDASTQDDRLVVGVWDDGPGFSPDAILPGHGLDNLKGRLAARFGDAATLTIARHDDGTLVTLVLPRTGRDAA